MGIHAEMRAREGIMSSIVVPRALALAMLNAQADDIARCATDMDGGFYGETQQPGRAHDDELAARMDAALKVRAAIVRAVDHGEPLAVTIVRDYIDDGIAYYEPYDDGSNHDGWNEILRDLTAWRDANWSTEQVTA